MARAQQNHGVKFCFHSGILSRRALENDDCRKGLPNSRQQEASGSSLFTAKVVSGTRLMIRCPDPCFTEARMELAQQLTGRL